MTITQWTTRAERPGDEPAIRSMLLAAFETSAEADLVDTLRADPEAWIDGLSIVTVDGAGAVIGQALLTRCAVGGVPALALAPCAVLPAQQGLGAGSAAIRGALDAAADRGENLVVVLGHAEYYPRFGFAPAAPAGVTAPIPVPDEAFMVLTLDPGVPAPRGLVSYPAAFGI